MSEKYVIGNHYYSYLLGYMLRLQYDHVVIVEDPKVHFSQEFEEELFYIDRLFLKMMGDEYDIFPLQKIEQYITPRPYYLKLGTIDLILGENPADSLQELYRKFPHLLNEGAVKQALEDKKRFNEEYFLLCQRFCLSAFHLSSYQDFSHDHVEALLASFVSSYFSPFFDKWKESTTQKEIFDEGVATLLFSWQTVSRHQFDTQMSYEEFCYFCFTLLMPVYKLEHQLLKEELRPLWMRQGGGVKAGPMHILYEKKRPILTIDGEKKEVPFSFYLGNPYEQELHHKQNRERFQKITFQAQFPEKIPSFYARYKFLGHLEGMLGSDMPLWKGTFLGDMILEISFYYKEKAGSKGVFFEDEALLKIKELFGPWSSIKKITEDHYYECRYYHEHERCKWSPFPQDFFVTLPYESDIPLYIKGPLNGETLGRFSFMINMKSF